MSWYRGLLNFLHRPLVKRSTDDPYHRTYAEFVSMVNRMDRPAVLEIGSRNVSGTTHRHRFPNASPYVGFDVHPGEGVDVVGDAHGLASQVEANSMDAVFSISVFEHLVFPWKVAMEINRVLKPGGYVFVATHPVWPAHELPWDFWRFPAAGLAHLFSKETGFEIIRVSEGLPCVVYSLVDDVPTRPLFKHEMHLGVSMISRKIGDYDQQLLRWDADIGAAVTSKYPRAEELE
jgi:SAM-dependent methyltransferase